MSVQISGIGFDPETNTLNVLFTGDEVLELKGRMQSSQADFQKKTDVDDAIHQIKKSAEQGKANFVHRVNGVQQSVAKKINDSLDERAQKKTK